MESAAHWKPVFVDTSVNLSEEVLLLMFTVIVPLPRSEFEEEYAV